MFKQVGTYTDKLTKQFTFLGKTFNSIGRDFKSGVGIRSLTNIVTQKDIDSLNNFAKAIQNGTNYTKAFKENLSKTPLVIRQQANEIIKLQNAQNKLKTQLSSNKITQEEYHTALQANQAQIKAITTQTQSLTLAQKASAVASKAAVVALNMLGNIAIAAVINLIIAGIVKLVNREKELKEATDNVISGFKSLKEETDGMAKNSNELVSEYAKLAKGVNNLGENVSLTSDEYERYKELANQIANDVPSLIQAYDNEGNAILRLRDNVDELTQSYVEAMKAKYQLALTDDKKTDKTAIKNFQESFNKKTEGVDRKFYSQGFTKNEAIKFIEDTLTKSYDQIHKDLASGKYTHDEEIYLILFGMSEYTIEKDFKDIQSKLKAKYTELSSEIETELQGMRDIANKYLYASDDYYNLDTQTQTILSTIINNIPAEDFVGLSREQIGAYVEGIITTIKTSEPEIQATFNELLQVDVENLPISDAKAQVDGYLQKLSEYLHIDANQLKLYFGFEFVDDNFNELQNVVNRAKDKFDLKLDWTEVFEDDYGVQTKEEIVLLSECIDKANTLTEAFELFKESQKSIGKEDTFDISTYQEQLETVYGNIEKLQDALTKLDENKFDFSGDIKDLIKAFPEYSTEILNASGDAEQLRIVLQNILNLQPNNLIKSLTALKSSLTSDEDIEAVDNLIKILRNSTSVAQSVDDLTTSLDDLSSAVSKFTKNQTTLKEAFEEQEKYGQLSADTIQSLVDAGYAQALVIDKVTGAVTLNKTAYEKLIKEKKKEIKLEIARLKVDLINPYKDETAAIADLERSLSTLNAAEREATLIKIANMRASLANSSLTEEQIRQKEQQLAELEAMLASLDAPDFGNSSNKESTDDPWKDEAESKIKEIQHLEAMGQISHEEYINRLDDINQKYFANNTKYLDDYNKYEEEIYKARNDREQDLFDQKIENLDKEKDKALENNDFETAKTVVNTQITETQNRIIELKASGRQDIDDEIKQLEDDLEDLDDTLNDIFSKEYEFKVSLKTNEIDDLDREFEKSGDTSIYDKQIGIYEGLIGDTQDEINRLLDLGYSMDSEEIQNLLDDMDGYSDKIADIWDKQTEIIKDNVDEQIKALDRNIENTGDTSLYADKIKVYEQAQKDIYDRIEFYRKKGYAEDSQIIKDLKEQWVEYGEAITDTLQEQADAQIEAYSELMGEQKEILEKQKETQDELFDSQITALEKQKEALEDVNEQLEKENTLNEKIKAIEDARNNVYKNRRMVYTVGGGWEIKDRQEDLDKVKEAQKDYSDELRQQEIDKIQDQIDAIEDAKSAFQETIDKQIKAIEESEKSFEDAMKASYEIRKKLDREFIASIVGEDKADEYLANANVATSDTEKDKQKNNTTSTTGNNTGGTQNNTEYNSSYSNPTEEKSKETKSDEITKTLSSTDLAIQKMYEMFSNKGAFTRNVTLDQFVSDLENGVLLKPVGANDVFSPNVLDTGKSNSMYNTINNNNSPVFNIDINVNGRDKDDVALANQIADIAEQKVITGLQAFNAGVHNASSTRRSAKR